MSTLHPQPEDGQPDRVRPDGVRPDGSTGLDGTDPGLVRYYDEDDLDEALAERDEMRLHGSRTWWVVGTLLVAAAVALAAWIGIGNARDAVSFRDIGYHVDSPAQVTSRWEVTKPKDRAVTCLLRAMDERHGTVGSVDVTVPAGVETALTTTTIRTTSLAVTGTVRSCELLP